MNYTKVAIALLRTNDANHNLNANNRMFINNLSDDDHSLTKKKCKNLDHQT